MNEESDDMRECEIEIQNESKRERDGGREGARGGR